MFSQLTKLGFGITMLMLALTASAQSTKKPTNAKPASDTTKPKGQSTAAADTTKKGVDLPKKDSAKAEPEKTKAVKYKVGFAKKTDTIYRAFNDDHTHLVEIKASNNTDSALKDYTVSIDVDNKQTSLPPKDYKTIMDLSGAKVGNLKENENLQVIKFIKDDPADAQLKPLKLVLTVHVKKTENKKEVEDTNNEDETTTIVLVVMPETPLTNYRLLGYLGTNFDLVDGVQPKNLFFATNIFLADKRKWGISLGLYGNRTMTKSDSVKNVSFTSRIISLNRDSIAYYRDTAMRVRSQVSDNIGAYFSPLFHIKGADGTGELQLYYAPQFEFIWRRTKLETSFVNNSTIRIDSARNRFPANTALPLITPLTNKTELNIYDVYMGLIGLLLRYETDEISIRISSSVGLNWNYVPISSPTSGSDIQPVNQLYQKDHRFFYFGRLWITEPTTGLTLGAEMSNYFGKDALGNSKAQPYYNVTLSKAFNLKNLAAFVKPLSNR